MRFDTLIKDIYNDNDLFSQKQIILAGWVRTLRASSHFGFIELNDGSSLKNIQIVFESDKLDNYADISKLGAGSSVTVKGILELTPGAKQPFELKADEIQIEGKSSPEYPLQKKRHSFEFLRTIAHLRPRTNTFNAVFRVRSATAFAIHQFFINRGFVYVHTPIITSSDCEGAGEMFRVSTFDPDDLPRDDKGDIDYSKDFFAKPTNLTVSGQLAVETYCMAFRNVYTFGPTFRAENSNTPRHAAEFWMIEPEMAFADINDDMDLAEDMIKYVFKYVTDNCPDEIQFFASFIDKDLMSRLENVMGSSFERITYTQAIDILKDSGKEFEFPVSWGMDLQTEHERYLTEEKFKKPVFVINYPKEIKAFYMKQNDDGRTVAAMDLLVPGVGEIIGGSQREDDYDRLISRMRELGLDEKDYWWYLDLRKYGTNKHAGFGLGFERAIMYLTGMTNIRDVISFPRTPKNAEF